MNRLGWLLLAIFLIAVGGFVALVDRRPHENFPPLTGREPITSVSVSPSGMAIPVAGVRADQLVDTFEDARGNRTHGALDIMAPRGTLVVAAAPGRIEKIFESEAGGHTLYIRTDGDRWMQYYAHLDRYAERLREGMHVARGQVIGAVGSTGNANPEGPHLHFEIKRMEPGEKWYQGRGINPYPLLAPPGTAR